MLGWVLRQNSCLNCNQKNLRERGVMKSFGKLTAIGVLLGAMSVAMYAKDSEDKTSEEVKRINSAANVLDEIMAAPVPVGAHQLPSRSPAAAGDSSLVEKRWISSC